ncbi:sentrin-specific protease 6-like isoform X1 [Branchiostoma floridae]|uniref:Sentrin-specific protease 6-like isoform X1 n=1 Tax=Branchiostoma floridae TaxID=7739 RepID=A0A9J7N1N1_BRAFL|nr:sentrin-specific protease 6-like isoform X1 [Branchiostoma floridae]
MAHRGSSGLLEALDTSAEREDQGYSDLFGFGNIIDTSDDSDYPGDPTEDTEEDDVVLVEETPAEVTGHKVTKRPLEFKGSFTKDYKIPRKTTDSEVVEASPVLPDKVQHYSSPLSKAQYPPCNTQYTPRTQNSPRINVKLMTGKNTFNSYRDDQQARVKHMNSDSNCFNRGNHTPQNSQKLSVHLPAFQTVAMKPRIVVDGHQVSSTVHASSNAVKHGVNRNSSSTTSVNTEDYSTDVAGSSGTSTVVTVSDTGNSSGSDTSVSPSVQIKLQHEKGHLTGGEAISTGGLQGGGRGMLNKGQAAARGGQVRRGRGRPPSALKGNAMGMNMLSSACVDLGDRCDADQTSGSSSSSNQKGGLGFQEEFLRQMKQKAAADKMRNVLSPPCRLGAWKHAEVERKTVISSSTVTSTTQLNGEASQGTQQVSRTAELGTEKKEADSSADGEEEEEAEDEGNISFLCKNCGNSTYQRDRCNSCGKNTLQKVSTNHDPLKPKARAPLSRKGMPATSFYKDKMARFSNIYSPGTSTATVSQSRITADTKQTQQRLYQPTTRHNTRNAGRPVGRPRVSQKVVPEVVLISDDEDEPPKPAVQPEPSPASQPSSRPSTPVPEPDTGHGTLQDSTSEVDSTQHKEVPETPVTPKVTPVKAFITGNKTAKFDIRAIRIGSRLIQPCEVVTSIEKGISLKVEDHTVELQQNDIVQSVAHFGSNTPFIQLCVTPKIGLALRSRLRFKKKEGLDWFDPGSSDASEKYILLLLHAPVPPTRADVIRQHLQTFSSQHGFVEVEDKEKANNILMALEVKEPFQKSEKTTFITTQSVLAKQDPSTSYKATSTEAQTPSPTPHRPSTEPRRSSTYARSSQGKTINEHRVSLPETSSRSSSPACRDHEEDDRDGFVGPIQKLMVYPPPPASGGITVTTEDLWCLRDGEFLNDVIIDFYLKYLMNTVLSEEDRKRTHIFSSFFYKRLMQRDHVRTRSEDNMHSTPIHRRHSRVKTWTRHVDLFSKDFVIVPINEHAHWYLAVVCFPGLDKEDPHPTFVPRLTRPPTPDLDPPTRPSTPASNPEQTTQQSTEESGSSAQQSSQDTAEVTSEQRSQVKGHDTALASSQSSVRSSEGQEDDDSSSSQGSITKGIQTEPLTREQIEAAFASQIVEEERIASRQSPRKCYETMEKVSLNPRRSPRKCADAASSSLDSTSQSSQQSSPSKRNSPRKKSEESLNQDSRHFIDEVKHSVIQSATSPRKKLKFPDAEQDRKGDEEKMDVDQDQEELSEEGKNSMETDERRAEAMQGEPMETEDRVGRETPASAIDTTRSQDQSMMDDSASDQSASAMSDQSLPTMSIRRRPCILLFDSLRGPRRAHVMKNLKEYLTVEWEVRKKDQPKREFNNMKGANPKVPQQTNYSDCGVFLLQYVETFFSNPIQDYSFPLSGLEHWFSRQRVKRKRWELQGLIQQLTEEQSDKGDDKT